MEELTELTEWVKKEKGISKIKLEDLMGLLPEFNEYKKQQIRFK